VGLSHNTSDRLFLTSLRYSKSGLVESACIYSTNPCRRKSSAPFHSANICPMLPSREVQAGLLSSPLRTCNQTNKHNADNMLDT
jgi:hypothetical protein